MNQINKVQMNQINKVNSFHDQDVKVAICVF